MFIKSLTVKNFRCFKEETIIGFSDGLTAFIGRNGSGKTSILDALNFLIGQDYLPSKITEKDFHCDANNIKDEIVIEGETVKPFFIEVDVISNTGTPSTVIVPCNKIRLTIKRREKAERVLDDPFIINKSVLPILGDINDLLYEDAYINKAYKIVSLEDFDSQVDDLETAREVLKDMLKGVSARIEKMDRYYQVKFKIKSGEVRESSFPIYNLMFNPSRIKGLAKSYYLTKNRDDDVSGSYSLIAKILTDLHWRYKKKHASGNGESINSDYDTLAYSLRHIIDEKGTLIHEINEKIKRISSDDKDFQIDFLDIDQPYKAAFVAKKNGNKLLLPNNLGSGFNILIAYALFAYVSDLEKIPVVLIIDEPELHLHSDWQKKMYGIFTEQTNLQFIYSTQSENFISLKNWRQIRSIREARLFPKHENKEIQATDEQTGTADEYLDDYARKNMHISLILRENLELFFSKKCILVEGPCEKYALPKMLKISGCDIEDYSVSIISVWGKTKIKIYQMICRFFGVNYFTIFDKDKKEDDESNAENSAIEKNILEDKSVKFSTSFEKLLNINGNNKFQKIVKRIDEINEIDSLDQEVKNAIEKIKNFIEAS